MFRPQTQDSAIWSDAVDDKLAKQEKRMLKNRESAARSRLRRQQFTEGLERENANLKVGHLMSSQHGGIHTRAGQPIAVAPMQP
jgi:hypothetical protein